MGRGNEKKTFPDRLPVGPTATSHTSSFVREHVRAAAREVARVHSFRPIETGGIEAVADRGQIASEETVLLENGWMLRRDGFVGVHRAAVDHGFARSERNLRFFHEGVTFREGPGLSIHQHNVLGFEWLGERSVAGEVEMIVSALALLRQVGVARWVLRIDAPEETREELERFASVIGFLVEWGGIPPRPWENGLRFEITRYDDVLIRGARHDGVHAMLGAPAFPAIGWEADLDRLARWVPAELAESLAAIPPPEVLIAYADDGVKPEALSLVAELRAAGVVAWFIPQAKNMTRHFRHASEERIPRIVILGGPEWDRGAIVLRNMETAAEVVVPLREAVDFIRREIAGEK